VFLPLWVDSLGSVVGITTRLQTGRFGVRIPAAVIFVLPKTCRRVLGPTQPGWVPRVKRPVHEVYHPSSSSAEVKIEWRYVNCTSLKHYRFTSVYHFYSMYFFIFPSYALSPPWLRWLKGLSLYTSVKIGVFVWLIAGNTDLCSVTIWNQLSWHPSSISCRRVQVEQLKSVLCAVP
jgi:hypothetical protein